MAKPAATATKTETASAPTTSESTALAATAASSLAHADLLGGIDLGGTTGLEEADQSDFRLGGITLNYSALVNGAQYPKTMWVNTLTEQAAAELVLVLLVMHKSRVWSQFVQGEGTKRFCSSWDSKIGTLTETGETRKCEGCPDAQWRSEGGKRVPPKCGEVRNVVAIDRATNDLVMLRVKRTAMDPWKTFLNKFFLSKRLLANGKRENMPLFVYETKLSAKMETSNGNAWAVPVFDLVLDGAGPKVLPAEEIHLFAETARGVREIYLERVREVADHDDGAAGEAGDTSFEFGANGGDRFADTSKTDSARAIETETRFG
jgi:hypothetical protein